MGEQDNGDCEKKTLIRDLIINPSHANPLRPSSRLTSLWRIACFALNPYDMEIWSVQQQQSRTSGREIRCFHDASRGEAYSLIYHAGLSLRRFAQAEIQRPRSSGRGGRDDAERGCKGFSGKPRVSTMLPWHAAQQACLLAMAFPIRLVTPSCAWGRASQLFNAFVLISGMCTP
jgi:hypothetical protein